VAHPSPARQTSVRPQARSYGARQGAANVARRDLDTEASASARQKLLLEIENLTSAERAADWTRAALPIKNELTADDAAQVEQAFEARLRTFAPAAAETPAGVAASEAAIERRVAPAPVGPNNQPDDPATLDRRRRLRIDKSMLRFGEPRRYRNKAHLRFVAQHACLVCGRKPSDPHHLRFMQPRGIGLKVSDEFTVPLCRVHHRAVHNTGNERGWWAAAGIDPTPMAQTLWRRTRGTDEKSVGTEKPIGTEKPRRPRAAPAAGSIGSLAKPAE
jgi:hypothetical protein